MDNLHKRDNDYDDDYDDDNDNDNNNYDDNNALLLVMCWHNSKKGKSVPLQAWSGPEGSRKLRFPDFMTTAQDGGKVVSLTHRPPLPPGNTSDTHFCYSWNNSLVVNQRDNTGKK